MLVGLIDQSNSTIREKIRPVTELFRRHLQNASLCVIEFADVARVNDAPLILEFKQPLNGVERLAVSWLSSEPINHDPAPGS